MICTWANCLKCNQHHWLPKGLMFTVDGAGVYYILYGFISFLRICHNHSRFLLVTKVRMKITAVINQKVWIPAVKIHIKHSELTIRHLVRGILFFRTIVLCQYKSLRTPGVQGVLFYIINTTVSVIGQKPLLPARAHIPGSYFPQSEPVYSDGYRNSFVSFYTTSNV